MFTIVINLTLSYAWFEGVSLRPWHLTFSWVQLLSNKLEFFVSYNIKHVTLYFDMHFFYKNLIVLHHGHNNFLFWHLCQIHTFNNNLNEEGMITSYLICVTSLWWKFYNQYFKNNRETLAKHVSWKTHSVIAKFRILRVRLKRKPSFW